MSKGLIKIYKELYITDPWPAVYLGEYDALILADLHLGIEGILSSEGVYLPRRVSKTTLDLVISAIEDVSPNKVIFLGDVKHGFSLLQVSEWVELKELFNWLINKRVSVEVVRGNHDNYLGVLLSKYNIPFHEDRLDLPPYTLVHGHKDYELDELQNIILMGNEHPSILLRDATGIYHKFKAFLFGEIYGKYIMILPPACELAPGSTINMMSKEEFLSPMLRRIDLDGFTPYLIVPGKMVKKFPPIKELVIT